MQNCIQVINPRLLAQTNMYKFIGKPDRLMNPIWFDSRITSTI